MAILYVIGGVVIEGLVFGNMTVSERASPKVARKTVLGAGPRHEKTGQGEERLSLSCKLAPEEFGGLGSTDSLYEAAVNATPVYVTRADGAVLGWYLVSNTNLTHRHLARSGTGNLADFTLELERTESPSIGSIIGSLISIFKGLLA